MAAEIFDAGALAFTGTGSLGAGRGDHSATLMTDGTVLIVGGHSDVAGNSLDSAEVYHPVGGGFIPTGSMTVPRGAHAAATLPDGTVLITGGFTAFPFGGVTLNSAEIYDPGTGTFAATGSMPNARGRFVAASLLSGDVLVAGGLSESGVLNQAEAFTLELVDTEPPVLSIPGDMSVITQDPQGTNVFFSVTATDDVDASPEVVCSPQAGSLFPLGTTPVTCTATDDFSNVATATFNVTVIEALAITVTPDASGTVDPITGVATVSGTATCSRSTQFFNVFGELVQIISNRAILSASFFAPVACVANTPVAWSATIATASGRFKAGKADVSLSTFACDNLGSCAGPSASAAIQLRAKK
jgi:HYR domain/Kelch motif